MAVTIDATVGGASANSYATVAVGDAYAASRLQAGVWTSATADDRAIALVEAARGIDLMDYLGYAATSTQALRWPRYNVVKRDGYYTFDHDEIPDDVIHAQIEYAIVLLETAERGGADAESVAQSLAGLSRVRVGSIEVESRTDIDSTESTKSTRAASLLPYDDGRVLALLSPYLASGSRSNTIRILRA